MSDLMLEALNLAMYGMGTVFLFLTALVFLTALMSRLVTMLGEPELDAAPGRSRGQSESGQSQSSDVSPTLLAAIAGAVKQYRERH
tara:strand:- start:17161 stop:17418 length:258 start_codon:yes stop_codon:yes gene_type:complete